MHCVEFFGSHDFAWILEPDVKPYLEFRETLTSNKKASTFLRAIEETDRFVALNGDIIQKSVAPDSATSDDTKELEENMQDKEFDALFGGEITSSNFKKNCLSKTEHFHWMKGPPIWLKYGCIPHAFHRS